MSDVLITLILHTKLFWYKCLLRSEVLDGIIKQAAEFAVSLDMVCLLIDKKFDFEKVKMVAM
jgi:hypothetical protein